ncbi:MAG: hypothetical protein CMG78_11400 [Marinobacter sp.]|nr:hypothetical protein [Marinobacter sp.]
MLLLYFAGLFSYLELEFEYFDPELLYLLIELLYLLEEFEYFEGERAYGRSDSFARMTSKSAKTDDDKAINIPAIMYFILFTLDAPFCYLTLAVTGAGAQRREPKAVRFWRPVDRLVRGFA